MLISLRDEFQKNGKISDLEQKGGRGVESNSLFPEPLVAPIIGVRLRYRSKWEICSDLAPIRSVLVKHKGYYL